ncbi:unnamed protein product, partial [Mesorhabditis belari]|uniref:Uncharacterized protein n=1 Tax=Mesorhabditis belari TaxID=2138241 RepID=A0AAF3F083_9BILA
MAMDNFENAVSDFQNELGLIDSKRELLKEMITLRFTDLQNDNAIMVLQVKVREMFAQLGEEYARLLKEQISIVKKLEDVDGILQKSQVLQQGRYELSKAEFLSEASMNLPNIDQKMLAQMLDNYKDSVSVEFRKHENEFEAQVRTHLNMEKLKAKMEAIRAKQQETQRKFNDEKEKHKMSSMKCKRNWIKRNGLANRPRSTRQCIQ